MSLLSPALQVSSSAVRRLVDCHCPLIGGMRDNLLVQVLSHPLQPLLQVSVVYTNVNTASHWSSCPDTGL